MADVLISNLAEIPFDDRYFGPLAATPWRDLSPHQLRQIYFHQGWLLLKGYLDRAEILNIRRQYLTRFPPSLFRPGTRIEDGVFSGAVPPDLPAHGVPGHPAHEFVRCAAFAAFVNSQPLHRAAEWLLGRSAVRLKRTPLRHFMRGQKSASRAHVDFSYLDAGSSDLVTLWVPVGDCPLRAGGLIYLEDSQSIALGALSSVLASDRPYDRRPLTHELRRLADVTGRRWLWTNYEAGDLVIHSPFTIHASVNSEVDTMRVSIDIRYSPCDAPSDPRWAADWSAVDGF